jgi:hypothetical protein
MQRFFALLALFVLSIPVGLSITGCQTNVGAYCNGLGYGLKTNQAATILLGPETTGISLAWGQTSQLGAPSASTCKGTAASISKYNYGRSSVNSNNVFVADVSPTGAVCGGSWNRNSPGGIADYTICTPPAGADPATGCTATTCGVTQMTVSAGGVSSNPVPVYTHPLITSISLTAAAQNTACYSQNTAGPVLSPFPPSGGGSANVVVLGPNGIPIDASDVGTITYSSVTPGIVAINNTSVTGTGTNGATTAGLPGSTIINATVSAASSGSAAGYFYTCPPASIALSVANKPEPIPVTGATPVNITAIIKDTKGAILNGLQLDYTSTQPQEIAVSTLGAVTTTWPGDASVSAICQPATCNPAPLSQIGIFGTGTPIVSNTLRFTAPGHNSNYLWMASTQSQFFSAIDLTTGTPSSPVKLPYIPNSMVMDQAGNNLYFGSYRELMIYAASTNALAREDTSVPGVVLAVSPDSSTVVINDQLRKVIYLYSGTSGITGSIGGLATRASFSPDGKNVYIVGPDALYVHNAVTGWSIYTASTTPTGPTQPANACNLNNNTPGSAAYDPFCGPGVAVTVPSIGPFVTGSPTTAYGFCPVLSANAEPVYYPQAASVGIQTDALAATDDGLHILGADAKDNELSDISVSIPTGLCPSTKPGDSTGNTAAIGIKLAPTFNQLPTGITASEIDQVVASPTSSIAFVTYNAAAGTGILPAYTPSTSAGGIGAITPVQLSGKAQSPVDGIFSPNETIFFVSTTGDNLVHYVDPVALKDTQTINPGLVDANGKPVPVQMMAVKPRSAL